ncbi:hypothetical protein Tco_0210216 [Tanacetum coccineum]
MSVRADRSFQYPVGIAENMLVEVGKFTFPADFINLEMEEDSKHSYSNDDTCFSIDVIDEILEEDFDDLLDEVTANEYFIISIDTKQTPFKEKSQSIPIIKSKHLSKDPPTDLDNSKPFPDHLNIPWVSPIHCVTKKGGSTVVTNENDELVPTRTFTGWRESCLDTKYPGLEVDKAKIDVISKLPQPNNIKALRHLFKKQDAKPRLIRWILLLQDFDIEIKDRKGAENVVADHLYRIENDETSDDSEVDDDFLGETLMEINTKNKPWFADFANYLVVDIIPKGMTYQQKNKFFSDLKHYFWEEPYLFKVCSDGSPEDSADSSSKCYTLWEVNSRKEKIACQRS